MLNTGQLSRSDLIVLQKKLGAEAYELADTIAKHKTRLEKAVWRRKVLDAAQHALQKLLDVTNQSLSHLHTTNANAAIIDHQEMLLDKYSQDLDQLPQHTARIPTQHELQLGNLKIQKLELKYIVL
jgi:predicted Zn-dependent peptidase